MDILTSNDSVPSNCVSSRIGTCRVASIVPGANVRNWEEVGNTKSLVRDALDPKAKN